MAREVRWTPEATRTFHQVVEYLQEEWSENEVKHFVNSTQRVVEYIKLHPRMFRSTLHQDIREALVTPHNLLIYKIVKNHIELLTFWDTRRNPSLKKY